MTPRHHPTNRLQLVPMRYSLQVDNIIATSAMEGITLDQATIDALVKIERGELDADEHVEAVKTRLRALQHAR